MNSKTNEILNDVIHTASQAILADDEAIKRQAVGDIIHALARVVPFERAARSAAPTEASRDGRARTPAAPNKTNISSINGSATAANSKLCCKFKYMRAGAHVIVTTYDSDGCRRINASIEKLDNGYKKVLIFKHGDNVDPYVTIYVKGGFDRARRIAEGAMKGLRSSLGHMARLRANKRNRLALTVERELAATVARHMDDDDLAQRIENS